MLTGFTVAAGLSVDSLAAAMATGVVLRRPRMRDAARVGTAFGLCQAGFALGGLLAGLALARLPSLEAWDHWIAFVLLLAVGGQMIAGALKGGDTEVATPSWLALLMMGVGTSIDAGVVGVGMGITEVEIVATVAIIGAVTFGFSFVGVLFGRCVGRRAGTCAQVLGGLGLVAIGVHILAGHLAA
jgi:putative Mn2+ efflux pump MntP